jgi:hypothetical protein
MMPVSRFFEIFRRVDRLFAFCFLMHDLRIFAPRSRSSLMPDAISQLYDFYLFYGCISFYR